MKLVLVCLLWSLCGCATLDATAGPDGKLTSIHYQGFLRQYVATLEETPDGVKITVGAQSELAAALELVKMGMLMGAAKP